MLDLAPGALASSGPPDRASPSVAVVITAYNGGHFLDDALRSVAIQTHPVDEVIVVDDGSQEDLSPIVARYPGMRLIRQHNQGPSAARNAGLAAATADHILFLDVDDVLFPTAVESGLQCASANPGVGFVYGAHCKVDAELNPIGPPSYWPVSSAAYHDLLVLNLVNMPGSVLYDRAKLAACGGFDGTTEPCEDYDVLLRVAREHSAASHPGMVAKYRLHDGNLSADRIMMLAGHMRVRKRHQPPPGDEAAKRSHRRGRWWSSFASALQTWRTRGQVPARQRWGQRARMFARHPLASVAAGTWEMTRRALPSSALRRLRRVAARGLPGVGGVDMGNLARITPISRLYGGDRGTPVDRHYIERFLARHAADVRGRVLEIGEATYSRRFGQGITQQDVLHVHGGNPEATLVGDLARPEVLPEEAFDCAIVTQTLQLIYDLPLALVGLKRALRPGGVLLVTVPGITASSGEWDDCWYWSLTRLSAERLFGEVFGSNNVEVEVHGNVYAATAFLHGLAVEEIERDWLDRFDPAYPLTITVRARRAD